MGNANTEAGSQTGDSLFMRTLQHVPDATEELLKEAWADKWGTAKHVGLALGTGAVAGKIFSMIIPARGPAAIATGIMFTIPLVTREYFRWQNASELASRPGADLDKISMDLAKGSITAAGDTALGFAGGMIGSSIGHKVATSDTAMGRWSQNAQRTVLSYENKALLGLSKIPEMMGTAERSTAGTLAVASERSIPATAQGAWFAPRNSLLETRLQQLQVPEGMTPRIKAVGSAHSHTALSDGSGTTISNLQGAKDSGMQFYAVTEHNHVKARGGVSPDDPRAAEQATVPLIAENPKAYAQQFLDAAKVSRDGEFVGLVGLEMGTIGKVGKPKTGGAMESGLMDGHNHSAQFVRQTDGTLTTSFRVTQPDGTVTTHVRKIDPVHAGAIEKAGMSIVDAGEVKVVDAHLGHNHGGEGTRSLTGNDLLKPPLSPQEQALAAADARAQGHHSGVNHINLYEVKQPFFESVKDLPAPPETLVQRLTGPFRRWFTSNEATPGATTEVQGQQVFKYQDGDYKTLVAQLDKITDSTGKRPVIQLNHPRYKADWDTDLPASVRGRDYGVKSFDSVQQWRDQFGKYASQIEIITGQAMNPNPVEVMRTTDLGPINMAGYIDKGLHVSPTFGRDDHFNIPGARPAGTEVYVTKLTKEGLLDAMRERRTTATTSTEKLSGHMTVNDRYFMGDILDQAAVPDLNIKMHLGGQIAPEAAYKVSLYGDTKIGDGRLAKPMQVLELKGIDILDTKGTIAFDQVQHKLGNKSSWYVEVQRTDPITANVDYMWTAPVWVEPVSAIHNPFLRGLIGAGTDSALGF